MLVESDYPVISEITNEAWSMVETIAEIRSWRIEHNWEEYEDDQSKASEESWGVVRRLEANWGRFLTGRHVPKRHLNRKQRRDYSYREWPDSEEDRDANVD